MHSTHIRWKAADAPTDPLQRSSAAQTAVEKAAAHYAQLHTGLLSGWGFGPLLAGNDHPSLPEGAVAERLCFDLVSNQLAEALRERADARIALRIAQGDQFGERRTPLSEQ
jgi:hypothetical protein